MKRGVRIGPAVGAARRALDGDVVRARCRREALVGLVCRGYGARASRGTRTSRWLRRVSSSLATAAFAAMSWSVSRTLADCSRTRAISRRNASRFFSIRATRASFSSYASSIWLRLNCSSSSWACCRSSMALWLIRRLAMARALSAATTALLSARCAASCSWRRSSRAARPSSSARPREIVAAMCASLASPSLQRCSISSSCAWVWRNP
mmetsp:Transcript_85554/g.242632  ORF Transcript_85554/g.242632 Transcript_85554/m.242632 type:complete len:209 (-) Transcript_85554:436-1062(-)